MLLLDEMEIVCMSARYRWLMMMLSWTLSLLPFCQLVLSSTDWRVLITGIMDSFVSISSCVSSCLIHFDMVVFNTSALRTVVFLCGVTGFIIRYCYPYWIIFFLMWNLLWNGNVYSSLLLVVVGAMCLSLYFKSLYMDSFSKWNFYRHCLIRSYFSSMLTVSILIALFISKRRWLFLPLDWSSHMCNSWLSAPLLPLTPPTPFSVSSTLCI